MRSLLVAKFYVRGMQSCGWKLFGRCGPLYLMEKAHA